LIEIPTEAAPGPWTGEGEAALSEIPGRRRLVWGPSRECSELQVARSQDSRRLTMHCAPEQSRFKTLFLGRQIGTRDRVSSCYLMSTVVLICGFDYVAITAPAEYNRFLTSGSYRGSEIFGLRSFVRAPRRDQLAIRFPPAQTS
jgi:hypothetical protein